MNPTNFVAPTDIAVVGLSCVFPQAKTPEDFWQLLIDKQDATETRSSSDLDAAGVPKKQQQHSSYIPKGSSLGDVSGVDLEAFGFGIAEAATLDPQHRIMLEQAWLTLDRSGHGHGTGIERVGVWVGTSYSSYLHHHLHASFDPLGGVDPIQSLQIALGNMPDYLATGIAYRLGLTGTAITVQTACSSSLVAIHQACSALILHEVDMALAGGVTVHSPAGRGYEYVPEGPFSRDGTTASYGAQASGAVFTEGAGMVGLRRLSDALNDGDPILAVIAGSAVNNDGNRKVGFTAPSPEAHAEVIAEALGAAGISPRQVSYIEGHGTGTPLGDPMEAQAFRTVFGTSDEPWCTIGSVKSNIGHTEAAAGIAGFIKTVLALQHEIIPASLYCDPPHPALGLEGGALKLAVTSQPWKRGQTPRYAGVSSLGFGGTNCHVVLKEAPLLPHPNDDPQFHMLPLSAASPESLAALHGQFRTWATSNSDQLKSAAHTLRYGRKQWPHRQALITDGTNFESTSASIVRSNARVIWAFPGGGSQRIGMLEDILRHDAIAADLFQKLRSDFQASLRIDIARVCAPVLFDIQQCSPDDPLIGLPALFATSIILADNLRRHGWVPDAIIGHSAGEYVAAVVSGVLSLNDAVAIVSARSQALAGLPAGGLLRVRCDADNANALCKDFQDCSVAAWNSPRSVVIAGPEKQIAAMAHRLGSQAELVPIQVPAHSSLVEPAVPDVIAASRAIIAQRPTIPWFSSVTGHQLQHGDVHSRYWADHMRKPVQFYQALTNALHDVTQGHHDAIVVNVGPGAVLASLAREAQHPRIVATLTVCNDQGIPTMRDLLFTEGQLFCLGAHRVSFNEVESPRIPLPDYPFHRTSAWVPYVPNNTSYAVSSPAQASTSLPLSTLHERRVLALRNNINHVHIDVKFFDSREALINFCSTPTDSEKPRQTICVVPDSVIGAAALIAVARSEHPEHGFYYLKCCDTARPEPDIVKQWFFAGQQQFPNALHFTLRNGQFFAVVPEPWSPTPKTGWPQNVVLIGGRGKIGSTIAKAAINAGSNVIQTSRSTSTPSVPGAQCVILDPGEPHAIEQFLGSIQAPEETAVIVCTGIVGFDAFEPLATTSADVFSHHSMAKADVAAHVIEALSRLGNHAPASLVIFSSLAAHIGGFGLGAYALANAEVEAITQQAADESMCPFTKLIAVASDGWRLGEQESFSEQLLATALESEEALASIATLLQSPAPSVVALAHEHAFARKHGIPDQSKPDSHAQSISDSNIPGNEQDVFEQLRSIWQEVLGIPITSNDADFFQLGGSSLLATKMLVLIEERTNKRLRLRDILQHCSINALAERLASAANIETVPAAQESATEAESPTPPTQLAPLTDVQRAYLIGRSSNFGDGAASCHSFIEYITPQIDIQQFTKALNTVIQRHQMLRTIVTFDGMKEVPLPPHGYQVSVTDIRQQTDETSALDRWRTQWAQRPPRADRWPLIDVAIAQASDGVHIGWSVDVLVCDASSFEILISEIGDVYNGHTLTELPQSSFFDYANSSWNERHSTQNIARKEAQSYWAEITPTLPPAPSIRGVEKKHGVFRRRAVNLGTELTEKVTQCAREHKTTESAVMLAAYQTFLARWSQQTSFTVMVTYFERPEKYAGVVGDFTTVIPCVLSADDDLHAVSNRLFEAMDHRAVSGVEILAQRSTLDGKRFLLPVVFTSMLGSSLRETSWCGRICYGISQTPQVILDHQIYRGDDGIVAQFDALDSAIDFEELDVHLENYVLIVEEICAKNSASTTTTQEDFSDSAIALARKYWADTLNIPADSIADDATFISLGGDSIAAIKLLGSLRNAGYSVELEQLLGSLQLRDLKFRDNSRVTHTAQLVRATPGEPFPLTPLQQAYWIGAQGGWLHSHGSAHFYVDYFDQTCTGENFAQALKLLIHHQPMLRAKILPDGTQIILDPHCPELQQLPLTITDLTSSTPEEIQQIIHNQRDAWCTTPMNPEHWPPFQCAVLLLPGGGARVAVQSSLAFVDGWSFYLFFEQLLALQDNPNTVFPTPSITFADYAVSLAALASSEEAAKDRQWWRNRIQRLAPAPQLPASLSKTTGMERTSLRYQKNVFDALASTCAEANITPSSAFFAAYVYALSIASGQQQMLISSLYFNRLPLAPDIDQVLGPFATTALVNLDTGISQHQAFGPKEFAKLAQHIMSQLSESLQHGSVSGIEVSRMAATMDGQGGNIAPVVFTSTLGFTDSASVEVTSRIDPRDVFERVVTPQVLMDCQVAVENEDIVVNLDSPAGAFPSDFSAAMLATIDAAISAFISNTDIDATSVARLTNETAKANQRLVLSLEADIAPHPEISHRTANRALLEQIQDLFQQFGAQTNGNNQLSFFAAGGDSLGMIRLLRQTQKDFNIALTPADFLEDPTVLGVAIKLQQAPELHWTEHLVALTSKQQSPKAICYLIHPSGGDILCYLDFVRGLRGIEVFGIPDPGLSHEEIHDAMPTAIDQLCELYAEFIIQHQIDHGTNVPFFVGGWSMGGTVAQEIVQLLRERGYEAAGLIMIDSNSPDRIRHLSGITEEKYRIEYARRYLASIQAFTNDMARPHQTSFHFEDDFDLYLNECGQNSPETKQKIAVFTRHLEGLASWNARPLQQTPTLLLIAEQLSPVNSNIAMGVDDASDSATLGWESNIPGDSDIATVPAHHYSVLREPAVNNVSQLVAAFIQRHTTTQLDRFSPSLFEE